jgi:ribosomal protein S18 acetylase RimI-like enzyme
MKNVLDNPVWNALISGNSHLAKGSERVRFFDPEVSPFAGLVESSAQNLLELYAAAEAGQRFFLWADALLPLPNVWEQVDCIRGCQMVYEDKHVNRYDDTDIVSLTEKNVAEMVALAKLTKPGPFATRTIEFGNYEGIFKDDKLVAMTGQRFHCFDHIEISAVCTDPAHLGKGYAKKLLLSQLKQITGSACKPYLHVREDNERAIGVYRSLGFSVRMPVYFYVIKKR